MPFTVREATSPRLSLTVPAKVMRLSASCTVPRSGLVSVSAGGVWSTTIGADAVIVGSLALFAVTVKRPSSRKDSRFRCCPTTFACPDGSTARSVRAMPVWVTLPWMSRPTPVIFTAFSRS